MRHARASNSRTLFLSVLNFGVAIETDPVGGVVAGQSTKEFTDGTLWRQKGQPRLTSIDMFFTGEGYLTQVQGQYAGKLSYPSTYNVSHNSMGRGNIEIALDSTYLFHIQ